MTRDELYRYLGDPRTLSAETLEPIRQLSEAYPYCSAFTFLYLYNLAIAEDVRYASELRRLSILLPDRERLFRLVEGDKLSVELPEPPEPQDDAFELIDHFLDSLRSSGQDLPQGLQPQTGLPQDYFEDEAELSEAASLEALLPEPAAAAETTQQSSTSSQPRRLQETSSTSKLAAPSSDALRSEEADLEESLLSETLSKIYIQQQRYDKALRIIRTLSLNYPEKNRFFADQIRFLERLIANNKSNNQ